MKRNMAWYSDKIDTGLLDCKIRYQLQLGFTVYLLSERVAG
jgi:hypothetical protein